MMLPRMITIATSTEIGRLYMRVVVGITMAVHTPDGMMYATSDGTWNGPQRTRRLDLSLTQPSTITSPSARTLPPIVLLKRYVISGSLGSRTTVNHFTSTPVRV